MTRSPTRLHMVVGLVVPTHDLCDSEISSRANRVTFAMRTRLRSYRRREDDLPQTVRAPEPVSTTTPPQNGLHALQRTIGNTAMRRYLHPEQSGPSSGLINRDSAKELAEQKQAAAPGRQTIVYMTVMDHTGKAIPGLSKRKGREGQFELLHFNVDKALVNSARVRDRAGAPSERISTANGKTTLTTHEKIGFVFTKHMDASSPLLMQLVAEGKSLILHFEVVIAEADGKESVIYAVDMPHAVLNTQTVQGEDTDANRTPLESYFAETVGMTTVLNAMADKVKQVEAKKPANEELSRK